MHRLHAGVDLPAHTYGRRNSVDISCACMGGSPDPGLAAPPVQLDGLCGETVPLPQHPVGDDRRGRLNRDGRVTPAYGPVLWGATAELWHLLQLAKGCSTSGGELRNREPNKATEWLRL